MEKKNKQARSMRIVSLVTYAFLACYMFFIDSSYAEVLERIVAIVNDDVILYSDLKEARSSAEESGRDLSDKILIEEMIERMLLLNEAENFWIEASRGTHKSKEEEDAIIKEYIDRRVKAFIYIPHNNIEDYFTDNAELFPGKDVYDVRDEIESRMISEELSIQLREHIEELRKNAYVRIQLEPQDYVP
jgi:hypothetical protein